MFLPVPASAEFLAGARDPDVAAAKLRGSTQILILGEAEGVATGALAR